MNPGLDVKWQDYEQLELPECVRNNIAQQHERWNNRLEFQMLDFAKDYSKGRLCFLIYLKRRPSGSLNNEDLSVGTEINVCLSDGDGPAFLVPEFDIFERGHMDTGNKDGVFVGDVKPVNGVQPNPRAAFVCGQGDKEFLRIASGCFYSVTTGFVIDLVVPSGEGCIAVACTAIEPNQFPRCMIQSGSQVVNGVTDDQCELLRPIVAKVNFDSGSAGLWIFAYRKVVVVRLDESLKGSLQISDVLFGPFNL